MASSRRGIHAGGDGSKHELKREASSLRSKLADALRLVDDLRAENKELQSTTAALSRAAAAPRARKRIRGLRKLSSSPLVFTIDDFVDEQMCKQLRGGGGHAMWELIQHGSAGGNSGSTVDGHKNATDALDAGALQVQLAFASLVASELFAGQWGANDGIRFNAASSSDANNDCSVAVSYPDGLHVDTNNGAIYRSCTCILYLNDVDAECGGATAFPLADTSEADPALSGSRALLEAQCTHTRSPLTPTRTGIHVEGGLPRPLELAASALEEGGLVRRPLEMAASSHDLEAPSSARRTLRVQPEAGKLCIFFTRTTDGKIDPSSWHGGERIRPPAGGPIPAGDVSVGSPFTEPAISSATEKHIMTLFKEVAYQPDRPWDAKDDSQSFECYLAPQIAEQRRYLEELAESHARFFEADP